MKTNLGTIAPYIVLNYTTKEHTYHFWLHKAIEAAVKCRQRNDFVCVSHSRAPKTGKALIISHMDLQEATGNYTSFL
jgi:hypothetical protein